MNNLPRELESLLRAAIEAGYTNGQNNPNGYLSSADRDACVATLLSEHGEPIPKEGFHNCTVTNDPNVGFLVTDEPAPALGEGRRTCSCRWNAPSLPSRPATKR